MSSLTSRPTTAGADGQTSLYKNSRGKSGFDSNRNNGYRAREKQDSAYGTNSHRESNSQSSGYALSQPPINRKKFSSARDDIERTESYRSPSPSGLSRGSMANSQHGRHYNSVERPMSDLVWERERERARERDYSDRGRIREQSLSRHEYTRERDQIPRHAYRHHGSRQISQSDENDSVREIGLNNPLSHDEGYHRPSSDVNLLKPKSSVYYDQREERNDRFYEDKNAHNYYNRYSRETSPELRALTRQESRHYSRPGSSRFGDPREPITSDKKSHLVSRRYIYEKDRNDTFFDYPEEYHHLETATYRSSRFSRHPEDDEREHIRSPIDRTDLRQYHSHVKVRTREYLPPSGKYSPERDMSLTRRDESRRRSSNENIPLKGSLTSTGKRRDISRDSIRSPKKMISSKESRKDVTISVDFAAPSRQTPSKLDRSSRPSSSKNPTVTHFSANPKRNRRRSLLIDQDEWTGDKAPCRSPRPDSTPVPPTTLSTILFSPNNYPDANAVYIGPYRLLHQIGEGTYGQVYKAVHPETGIAYALKKIRLESEKEGFPITATREIKLLRQLQHPNIVKLIEMRKVDASVFMVFEYLENDMAGLFNRSVTQGALWNKKESISSTEPEENIRDLQLSTPDNASPGIISNDPISVCRWTFRVTRHLLFQLLSAVAYLHAQGVLHRDIKGSNCLLGRDGVLKLADFGLARREHPLSSIILGESSSTARATNRNSCSSPQEMPRPVPHLTNRVITLWYRPPELLLGASCYSGSVDMWSIGCLALEWFIRRVPFNGANEITQLDTILKVLGTPPGVWTNGNSITTSPDNQDGNSNSINVDKVRIKELLETGTSTSTRLRDCPWIRLFQPSVTYSSQLETLLKTSFQADPAGEAEQIILVQNLPIITSFLSGLLALEPDQRLTPAAALNHPFFQIDKTHLEDPASCIRTFLKQFSNDFSAMDQQNSKLSNPSSNTIVEDATAQLGEWHEWKVKQEIRKMKKK